MRIGFTGKVIGVALGLVTLYYGAQYLRAKGILGTPSNSISSVPVASKTTHFTVSDVHPTYTLPVSARTSSVSGCPVMEVLAWNGESGLTLANGGALTQRASLMDKYTGGGCLNIKRQDDYGVMEANLIKFIQTNGQDGTGFFVIMGDGYPYVAAALNKQVSGKFSAVGVVGFSDGEDQCMMTRVRADAKGRGALIAAVPRDGDWNICVKYAADNGIKVNTNQKTYDADAMNFMDVNMFTDADDKLIAKACEDRQSVSNGIAHGSVKTCVDGVATWTPGDVDVVEKYDGDLVSIATTHDYQGQMPALIIGAKDWMTSHRDYVVGILKATDRAAMAIRSGGQALMQAGAINAQVFGEKDAGYWARLYKGDVMRNHAGQVVRVGGSKVITLSESRDYFGMRSGTANTFESVYRTFKGYDEDFYPTDYPKSGPNSIPSYTEVVDTSYLAEAVKDIPETQGMTNTVFAVAAPITQAVSKKSWHIEFNTGSATIKDESFSTLKQIMDSATIASGLRMQFDGYTDDTGSATINTPLSQARAEAVSKWLNKQHPNTFPEGRMEAHGYGPANPLCSDASASCRAQNRRVEVTLGQ